ncbi:MAG: hypothetical protein IT424_05035 [Pirellulales bacterium]|nr:hypothetical protein [Pirellulales bacterium]
MRCPRIDPTGERCLIWPKDEPAVAAVAPPTNPLAPPATTDPYYPQIPAAAPTMSAVTPAAATVVQRPQDQLSVTPARVLAPVGSEVVLKASICTSDGYTLADQKIEWMLGRSGVGQFVEVGGKGVFHPPLFPWNGGKKVDNYLATGYTANGPLCIDRGTADPTDDVNVHRGDGWISVTSPNEGTSHVTVYAPAVQSWDQRKAAATIYWVDVQWSFPPPVVVSAGQGETLTTVVTRQSDGTPLAGWVVRYEVADAAGSESGVREVVTEADGRAAAQVTPTASGAASSQINMQLIRPAGLGGSDAPRLVVASGSTTVNWSGGSTYLPPETAPSVPAAPPALPSTPQNPSTPQPQLPSAIGARLELQLEGPTEAVVGANAPLRIVLRNAGDAPASNVVLRDDFDPAFYFPFDPASKGIAKRIGTLQPGQLYDETLPFQVNKAGRLCHQIVAQADGAAPVNRSHCVNVAEPPPQREALLDVRLDGERQRVVGETATFVITVKNAGQVPLVNVETVEEYLPASVLQPIAEPGVEVVSNTVSRRIPRLDVGQQQRFETRVLCLRPAATVGPIVRASAQTDPPSHVLQKHDDHYLEIIARDGARPGGPAGPTPPPAGSAPLGVAVAFLPTPARVGASATCEVTVSNRSSDVQEQVAVKAAFPPELAVDAARIQGPPNIQWRLDGNAVTFTPLAALRPTEVIRFVIGINPQQSGVVSVTAGAISSAFRQGVSRTEQLEVIGNTR